ncbi:MAG: GAF domain-containing protein [Leptolyngbya sp. SIO4C1]|nr:GAF domain-containing protein [Leptolyngbya sp. SIO4C1]
MPNHASIVEELLQALPTLRPQMYFKTSLTALSHAMEDQVLAGTEQPLVIASFQQERFYRQEAHRYTRIAEVSDQIYVLSAAGTGFENHSDGYETIAFDADDPLTQEWHLVVLGEHYSACLICREHQPAPAVARSQGAPALDQTRRFEGLWTLDRPVSQYAADRLLARIESYRPELHDKIAAARSRLIPPSLPTQPAPQESDPFAQRLVTYVQASQYKLLKAYKALAAQEQRERLINSITAAIRQSLNSSEIFAIAAQELGSVLAVSRCIIYRYAEGDSETVIQHEFRDADVKSLQGEPWPLEENPLFQWIRAHHETLAIGSLQTLSEAIQVKPKQVRSRFNRWQIRACLMVPLIYQNRLLGMIELHQCTADPKGWGEHNIKLVEAIANQLSVALIQAEAYANLEDLNHQLEALERTRSNLIAITGHELRTPLSTIRVCLESLISEPEMPLELQETMLQSAMTDAERMQKLVQDFLTLSRLESGRIEWNLESLSLQECVVLALSSSRIQGQQSTCPPVEDRTPSDLPFVRADGEWVVEVLSKLLDNACKFTEADGLITIDAEAHAGTNSRDGFVEVTVTDSGRGIEPDRLETVFERFYQEEGALRRSVGGTGLGLAICRQIVEGLGGKIWATSAGKQQGTQIHFTLPIAAQFSKPSAKKRAARRMPTSSLIG